MNSKRIIALIIICFIFAFFGWLVLKPKLSTSSISKSDLTPAYLGNNKILVRLAQTAEEKKQGLSNAEKLDENEGMLFLFPIKQRPVFWMKEMNFPLDFIWIADDRVVDLTVNLLPAPKDSPINQIPSCQPKRPIDSVLEVNAGFVEKNKIKINDRFRLATE